MASSETLRRRDLRGLETQLLLARYARGREQADRERLATRFEPLPPDVLSPKQTWRATISAPGSLVDGAYVRVSFGPRRAKGDPPEGMEPTVVWITDRSYRL